MAKIKFTYETTLSVTIAIDSADILGEAAGWPIDQYDQDSAIERAADKSHEQVEEFLNTLGVGYAVDLSADATIDGMSYERVEVVPDVVRARKR